MLVKGAVPGAENGRLIVTSAAKGQPKPVQVQAKKGKDKDGKEAKKK